MEKQLKSQEKESIEEINVLQKKVKYLEKQFADSQNQLRDIVSSNAQLNVDLHGSSLVYSFMLNRGRRGTLLTNAPRSYLCITGLTKTPVTFNPLYCHLGSKWGMWVILSEPWEFILAPYCSLLSSFNQVRKVLLNHADTILSLTRNIV